jgi:hypothetical protein
MYSGSRLGCLYLEDGGSKLFRRLPIYQYTRRPITEDVYFTSIATVTCSLISSAFSDNITLTQVISACKLTVVVLAVSDCPLVRSAYLYARYR